MVKNQSLQCQGWWRAQESVHSLLELGSSGRKSHSIALRSFLETGNQPKLRASKPIISQILAWLTPFIFFFF